MIFASKELFWKYPWSGWWIINHHIKLKLRQVQHGTTQETLQAAVMSAMSMAAPWNEVAYSARHIGEINMFV